MYLEILGFLQMNIRCRTDCFWLSLNAFIPIYEYKKREKLRWESIYFLPTFYKSSISDIFSKWIYLMFQTFFFWLLKLKKCNWSKNNKLAIKFVAIGSLQGEYFLFLKRLGGNKMWRLLNLSHFPWCAFRNKLKMSIILFLHLPYLSK